SNDSKFPGFPSAEFVVIHNGIITNYKELKEYLAIKQCVRVIASDIVLCLKSPVILLLTLLLSNSLYSALPALFSSRQERKPAAHWCAKRAQAAIRAHLSPVQQW
ncbi:hypothetical protein XENOCAPTIV_001697, partial [Xenoophorus captivus]